MKQTRLIIYRSPTGRGEWEPCPPDEVPEFVKDPKTMGRLVAGEACMDCAEGSAGSDWYMARRIVSKEEQAAIDRRNKRNAKRLVH